MWINLWFALPVLSILSILLMATVLLVIRETRAIRRKNADFEFITNNIADLIIRIDKEHRILWLNPASLIYFGLESSFCVGKDLTQIMRENHFHLKNEHILEDTFQLGRAAVVEGTIRRPGEIEQFIELKIVPEPVKSGLPSQALLIFHDITVRKKNEISLVRAMVEAKESDRKKSAFLASMSHDMRTPLNAIVGFSQILVEEGLEDEEKTRYFEYINQNNNLLIQLVNDIIDISKLESNLLQIRPSTFDLNSELEEILMIIENEKKTRSKKHIILSLEKGIPEGIFMIKADSNRLRQVLINLLVNALKFTPKGFIQFGYRVPEAGRILFYVRDTGVGIPPEQQENIFNYFKQVESQNGRGPTGSGLGLTISRQLVSLMGGHIWVESEEGKGSVFYFTITSA
ncbi:MAG: ATP-binding protein [Bacteroidales bacterium]